MPLPASANKLLGLDSVEYAKAERRTSINWKTMGTKFKHLYAQIADMDNLWAAYHRTAKGKRKDAAYLQFRQSDAANLRGIRDALLTGTYRPGETIRFIKDDPKPRIIDALPFRDRIIQNALDAAINPVFEPVFLPQSYACRKGMGQHRAAIKTQAMMRQTSSGWTLKTDFSKYFHSVDHATLWHEIKRKISCRRTLWLIRRFISTRGKGICIGHLLSQICANIYGHMLDRWLVHNMKTSRFVRYMDDVVVVGHSKEAMRLLCATMQMFARHSMGMKFSHWSVQPISRGVNFCGYRIWTTHKLLRKSSVHKAKRKIAAFDRAGDIAGRDRFLAAWTGHARWADSHNLLSSMGVAA